MEWSPSNSLGKAGLNCLVETCWTELGFRWWERVVSAVVASRVVVVGESHLQVGQFVFGFLCTWLLI